MDFKKRIILLMLVSLSGCQAPPSRQAQDALDKAAAEQQQQHPRPAPLNTLPEAVNQALQPLPVDHKDGSLYGQTRYDIQADKVDAKQFFAGLVKGTPYSVAIHPQVSGTISLDLKQVTLADVFHIVNQIYGYDIQKSGNVFRIYPAGMRTETFSVNYLLMQRNGMTRSTVSTGGVSQLQNGRNGQSGFNQNQSSGTQAALGQTSSAGNNGYSGMDNQTTNGTNIVTSTDTDFWKQLKESLQGLIGHEKGRAVIVSPQAGLVTVRAMPDEIRTIKAFLKTSQEHIQRQVVLEARIVEVVLSNEYQQGINWQKIATHIGNTALNLSTSGQIAGNAISASMGGITSLSVTNQDFSGVLSLLSTQGNVQVLSSPRVTATNNQKAVIKVGNDEYFVTNISSQQTATATSTSTTPNIQLTPFFSGIALDVTPQIDKKGGVMLHVHPSVIDTKEQEKVLTLDNNKIVLPLAQSNIRESDTVIRANSGEIVVIGGLMQSTTTQQDSKTPVLGDIPILGNLFTSKHNVKQKKELVILLKPTVVGAGTWAQQLQQSRQSLADWSNQ